MKELKNRTETPTQESLYEQAMKAEPRFKSHGEAVEFYANRLDELSKKRKTTVAKLLAEAENSGISDEDYIEARHLWMTLSSLQSLGK